MTTELEGAMFHTTAEANAAIEAHQQRYGMTEGMQWQISGSIGSIRVRAVPVDPERTEMEARRFATPEHAIPQAQAWIAQRPGWSFKILPAAQGEGFRVALQPPSNDVPTDLAANAILRMVFPTRDRAEAELNRANSVAPPEPGKAWVIVPKPTGYTLEIQDAPWAAAARPAPHIAGLPDDVAAAAAPDPAVTRYNALFTAAMDTGTCLMLSSAQARDLAGLMDRIEAAPHITRRQYVEAYERGQAGVVSGMAQHYVGRHDLQNARKMIEAELHRRADAPADGRGDSTDARHGLRFALDAIDKYFPGLKEPSPPLLVG